jgi:hypothetical protein
MTYSNRAFTTRWWPAPSSTTLPALMALLLELLELRPGMRAYQMEFSPLSESSEHKPVFGADAWAINRNCFRQLVRL